MNGDETVEQVCEALYAYPKAEACDDNGLIVLNNSKIADRIRAAHDRKVAGLVADLHTLERAIEIVCDKKTAKKIIATKKEIQNENR